MASVCPISSFLMLIDAHNHLQDVRFAGKQDEIIDTLRKVGVTSCVVNGTEPSDWSAVAELATNHADFVIPSFGLHPWKTKGRADNWFELLRDFLNRLPHAGVGEIGLDRWIEDHDIEDQTGVFEAQLQLAAEMDRPCTVHCLRAWGQLLKLLASCRTLPRFLVHSFGGSIETGMKLADMGAYFSFSGYFLDPRKSKVVDVFRQLPQDRILVETDAPDMLLPGKERLYGVDDKVNHPANLVQIRHRLIELIEISSDQLNTNTRRWLGMDADRE